MRESVPTARYSPVCIVLRQWKTSLILTYRVYRLYDTVGIQYIYIPWGYNLYIPWGYIYIVGIYINRGDIYNLYIPWGYNYIYRGDI